MTNSGNKGSIQRVPSSIQGGTRKRLYGHWVGEHQAYLWALIEREQDRLARAKGFQSFFDQLKTTVSKEIPVLFEKAARGWTHTISGNVLAYMETLFILKAADGCLKIAPRPKVTASESLNRLRTNRDDMWDKAWIEMPWAARRALRTAGAHVALPFEQIPWRIHPGMLMAIPLHEEIAALIEPAIKIVPIIVTTEKTIRDHMFGSMLRCYWLQATRPTHDRAWKFVQEIERCYKDLFLSLNPELANRRRKNNTPKGVFDIPLRRATREEFHKYHVRWDHCPASTKDVEARIGSELAKLN